MIIGPLRRSTVVREVIFAALVGLPLYLVIALGLGASAGRGGEPWTSWPSLTVVALAVWAQSFFVSRTARTRLDRESRGTLRGLAQSIEDVLGKETSLETAEGNETNLERVHIALDSLKERLRESSRQLITAREETERQVDERTRQLARAKNAAEETMRLKSQFLANVSHELRTPMHAILSFSRFGRSKAVEPGQEKLQEYFSNINDSGSRLLSLLDELLDLSKLEAGKSKYSFQSDDLVQLVEVAIDELRLLAAEKNCTLRLTEATSSMIQMDRKRMAQVVRNILGNAIKFSPDGATVHLRVRRVDGAATVEIRDEGVGIPEEDLDGIFEKFVQARNVTSDAGGTGLGLAISREIINAHNGEIWVYNHRAGGAVFVFSVPLYVSASTSTGIPAIRSRPALETTLDSNSESTCLDEVSVTAPEGTK